MPTCVFDGRPRRRIPYRDWPARRACSRLGLPPAGGFVGKAVIEESATKAGYWWSVGFVVVAAVVSAGAILRAAGRVFMGWSMPCVAGDGSIDALRMWHSGHAGDYVLSLVLGLLATGATWAVVL